MAAAALLAWPLVALAFYAALGPARGLIWSVPLGWLFLPESYGFKVPLLPDYDKGNVLVYSTLLALLFARAPGRPLGGVMKAILAVFGLGLLASPVATWLTNTSGINAGDVFRSGLSYRDGLAGVLELLMRVLPFLVALRILNQRAHQAEILRALVVLACGYVFLVLFELRMSPQLHNMVYGYFPHSWSQHLRAGGYRPLVFLSHGLILGFFLLTACLAAAAMWRRDYDPVWLLALGWLFAGLVLSRNLGAFLIVLAFLPVVMFLSPRAQIRVGLAVLAFFLLYPLAHGLLSGALTALISSLSWISPDRMSSFAFRLANESILLERALEKPLFGWGGYGRNRVFEGGRDVSITDGGWIVDIGRMGWFGFLTVWGVIATGMIAARRQATPEAAGVVILAAVMLIYNIPNAVWVAPILLGLGSILATSTIGQTDEDRDDATAPATRRDAPRYSRFAQDAGPERLHSRPVQSDRRPVAPRPGRSQSRPLSRFR